jgi:outer membrane protein OmpA-like peptidoglycan-associated protein
VTSRFFPAAASVFVLLGMLGCQTAYNNAYNQEYERLKQQDAAAHAEAAKYAAVIYFPTGSAALDEDAKQQLRWFAEKQAAFPHATFDVQGFADSTGGEATNQSLSGQRAQACAGYLSTLGIEPARMKVTAFSTASPAASNASAQGRKSNRRVEITVR